MSSQKQETTEAFSTSEGRNVQLGVGTSERQRSLRRYETSFFYNPLFGSYYYGLNHPMKPFRLNLVQELLLAYGVDRHINIFQPRDSFFEEMTLYHTPEYIRFLKTVTPETVAHFSASCVRFSIGEDCPVFPGLYDYCSASAGGSIAGAAHIARGYADCAINWMGGLHHAKASEASGFCYVNDIVLGILELLKTYKRVLYVDIDIHHGDGVEEAFYTSDRVMTCSFHKFARYFFPETGSQLDIGAERGRGYSLNIPLEDAIDDESYMVLFKPIISEIMRFFDPDVVVLQSGADSLAGDRLGCFNLTLAGHGECLRYVQSFGKPVMVLGGGGYTLRNVARCWTYETALSCGQQLAEHIPNNLFYDYFAPDFTLPIMKHNLENLNKISDLHEKLRIALEQIRSLPNPSPSVALPGRGGIYGGIPMAVSDEEIRKQKTVAGLGAYAAVGLGPDLLESGEGASEGELKKTYNVDQIAELAAKRDDKAFEDRLFDVNVSKTQLYNNMVKRMENSEAALAAAE